MCFLFSDLGSHDASTQPTPQTTCTRKLQRRVKHLWNALAFININRGEVLSKSGVMLVLESRRKSWMKCSVSIWDHLGKSLTILADLFAIQYGNAWSPPSWTKPISTELSPPRERAPYILFIQTSRAGRKVRTFFFIIRSRFRPLFFILFLLVLFSAVRGAWFMRRRARVMRRRVCRNAKCLQRLFRIANHRENTIKIFFQNFWFLKKNLFNNYSRNTNKNSYFVNKLLSR